MQKEYQDGIFTYKKECCICSKQGNWTDYLEYNPKILTKPVIIYTCPDCGKKYADQIKHFWLGINFGFAEQDNVLPILG